MKIEIQGNYSISDLVPVFQHLVAQLEDLGIGAVENVVVSLDARHIRGTPLVLSDDAGPASQLVLEIAELARPCVGSGKLRVVEAPTQRRVSSRQFKRHSIIK
ncbi:MAG: hypothetical protein CTY39_10750 [Hyphomicrobium sp.]|nr:MAG: hypothetical protein CTY39_10750 [Hyphomicrobium sp.]